MIPSSLPVSPAQPTTQFYGLSSLNVFQVYTRKSFFAAFGIQPQRFDPTQPPRNWFDTSANPGPYDIYVQANNSVLPVFEPLAVPTNVGMPNLIGAYQYPAYVNPAATPAELTVGVFPAQPIGDANAIGLCSIADALAVQAAMPSGTSVGIDTSQMANITMNGESRQPFTINVPGGPQGVLALTLRKQMTQQINDPQGDVLGGVGAPGSFTVSGETITWVPTPDPGLTPQQAATPVPGRALLPGEIFVFATLGAVEVENTGMAPATGGTSGGGLTAQEHQMLAETLDGVNKLLATFGKPPEPTV